MAPVEHVVIIKFRESTDDAAVASFFDEAAAMATQIPGITRFMHGRNCSPEGLSGDFTHMFVMSFENAAACDSYLPHPIHEAFKAKWIPCLEKVFVMDI